MAAQSPGDLLAQARHLATKDAGLPGAGRAFVAQSRRPITPSFTCS